MPTAVFLRTKSWFKLCATGCKYKTGLRNQRREAIYKHMIGALLCASCCKDLMVCHHTRNGDNYLNTICLTVRTILLCMVSVSATLQSYFHTVVRNGLNMLCKGSELVFTSKIYFTKRCRGMGVVR